MVITHHLRDNVLNNSALLHADNSFCGDDQIPVITTKSKISGFYNSIYNSFLGMPAFQVILLQDTPEMLCVPVCQLYVTVFACRISKICIGDIHSPSSPSCGKRK